MEYQLKGLGVTITAEVRDYLDKRLVRAERFLTASDAMLDVELHFSEGQAAQKYRADYTVTSGKYSFRVEATAETLHEAVDTASEELFRKLSQEKSKRLHMVRRQAARIKNFLRGWGRGE